MSRLATPAACPQPLRALQLANQVRRARSELKARIADGQLPAAEVILICPSAIASMPIAQLLASQHGWGEVRSRAFLAQVAVAEDKSIGSLTERQRSVIASLLTRTAAGAEQRSRPDASSAGALPRSSGGVPRERASGVTGPWGPPHGGEEAAGVRADEADRNEQHGRGVEFGGSAELLASLASVERRGRGA